MRKATKKKKKINILVIIFSVIALIFLYLMYFYDWLFIVPAAILSYLSSRELMKK